MDNSKIVVAQYWTSNLSYGKYTRAINNKYCEEKGYTYYVEDDSMNIFKNVSGRAITWYKPKFLLEVFEKLNPEYVLFLDADAIVCGFDYNIQDFIDNDFNIICTEDYGPSLLNAGVFIMKNTQWTKDFLQKWWDIGDELEGGRYKNALWHDQTCFGHLMNTLDDSSSNIKKISNKVLNGRTYKNQQDKNFIFHAFGYGQVPNRTLDYAYYDIMNIERPKEETLEEMSASYGTDKSYEHKYFSLIYDKLLTPLKHEINTFIEIGCLNGESLILWRDFFVNANVVGIDINIEHTKNSLKEKDNSRLDFIQMDGSNEEQLDEVSERFNGVDVILDDASHRMLDQQITLAKFFKCLKPGGIFIMEDLHTSVEATNPAKAWCGWGDPNKTLTLNMLEEFNNTGKLVSDYINDEELEYLNNNIASIEVYKQRPDWSITAIITKK